MPDIRIGISGWTYVPWRGTFYPPKLAHKNELAFASRQLNSIEINGSFYSLQTPKSYAHWYAQTPEDFVFAVKGGRYITHLRRLRDVRIPLANFFASGLLLLKQKLGPILWQFPPNFQFDAEKIETFFDLLPRTTKQAAKLARAHEKRFKGRVHLETDADRPIRYAMEIRHDTFKSAAFVALLRKHNVALVVADTAGKWPMMEDLTSDFVYLRLHGDEQLYVSGYTDAALDHWANRIRHWCKGQQPADAKLFGKPWKPKRKSLDVHVYFDNDVKVRAPVDAIGLSQRLGIAAGEARAINVESIPEEPRPAWPAVKRGKEKGRKASRAKPKR
jgi:uncharacterized protein YecE (DUF72 family)